MNEPCMCGGCRQCLHDRGSTAATRAAAAFDALRIFAADIRAALEEIERLRETQRKFGTVQHELFQRAEEAESRLIMREEEIERLRADIVWQAQRIAELEKDVPTATQKVWRAEANRQSHRAEAAEAREAKLREALRHYGTHRLPGCHYAMAKTCQCGLAAALTEEDASDRRMRQEVDR